MDQFDRPACCDDSAGSVTCLISQLRAGDPDKVKYAVGSLWERYYQPLVRFAAPRMLPGMVGAEDLVQEVIALEFPRLIQGPKGEDLSRGMRSRARIQGFLFRLTRFAASDRNAVQKRQQEKVGGESAMPPAGFAAFPSREPPPESKSREAELLALLNPKKDEQGERLQAVARMVMEGYKHAEIAEKLGCSEKTVGAKVKLIRRIWCERGGIEVDLS